MRTTALAPALLEEWMRRFYFEAEIDIGSSGVEDYSLRELRQMLGVSSDELDAVVFHDSQTLGGGALRQALADRYLAGDATRVMVTHGSTEANFLIMTTLLDSGDEVIVLEPCYQQLWAIAEAIGCRLKSWHLRFENDFRPDFDELRELLSPATRMVVVNFPHNPTGTTLTREEQQRLIELTDEAGAYLAWDGAFTELAYDGPPLPDPINFSGRALSMGTLSKAFGLPGSRVGWCFAAPELLERFVRTRDYTLLHLSPLIELVAAKAIVGAGLLIGRRLEQARRNRALVASWMEQQQERVRWVAPRGGVCCFPSFADGIEVDALCHRLIAERRVLLVPGSCFGSARHARLGFGCATPTLERGLITLSELILGG